MYIFSAGFSLIKLAWSLYSLNASLFSSSQVWDAGSGSLLQKLPADLPVLDISPFTVNGKHFLASLTEKMLKLYRWE